MLAGPLCIWAVEYSALGSIISVHSLSDSEDHQLWVGSNARAASAGNLSIPRKKDHLVQFCCKHATETPPSRCTNVIYYWESPYLWDLYSMMHLIGLELFTVDKFGIDLWSMALWKMSRNCVIYKYKMETFHYQNSSLLCKWYMHKDPLHIRSGLASKGLYKSNLHSRDGDDEWAQQYGLSFTQA